VLWVCPSGFGSSFSRKAAKNASAFGAAITSMTELDAIASTIVDAAFHIARDLGPGMKESVYETVLAADLSRRGQYVERQKWVSCDYKGIWFENAFRIDLVIERRVAVEIKSAKELRPSDYKQLLTYSRMADLKLGFLLNYGESPDQDEAHGKWRLIGGAECAGVLA